MAELVFVAINSEDFWLVVKGKSNAYSLFSAKTFKEERLKGSV